MLVPVALARLAVADVGRRGFRNLPGRCPR